jgi:hypothetical protein
MMAGVVGGIVVGDWLFGGYCRNDVGKMEKRREVVGEGDKDGTTNIYLPASHRKDGSAYASLLTEIDVLMQRKWLE